MNYFQPYSLPADQAVLAAWDSQLAELAECPALVTALAKHREMLPRFAESYMRLRALPRGTRRALQRKLARARELISIQPEWQRKLAGSLAGAALLLALAQSASATTMTVTTNVPDIKRDKKCSLIEAIINAKKHRRVHTDCPAGSGTDTIVLPGNTVFTFNKMEPSYIQSYNGLPTVTSIITIEGNGSTLRRNSKSQFGLVDVNSTGNLTLKNLTISNWQDQNFSAITNRGKLTIVSSTISGNMGYEGGAIYNSSGAIAAIENSTISGNSARRGGGIHNYRGTIIINNSSISQNTAAFSGGGIRNVGGHAEINNSIISENRAIAPKYYSGHGGGIDNIGTAAYLLITYSSIAENLASGGIRSTNKYRPRPAGEGGGIYNGFRSTVTISNSSIFSNTAETPVNGYIARGGGILSSAGGDLRISNSTVSGNTAISGVPAKAYGGGIFSCVFQITSSTIADNRANVGGGIWSCESSSRLELARSIISGNQADKGAEVHNGFSSSSKQHLAVNNFNLFGNNGDPGVVGVTPGASDIVPGSGIMLDDIIAPLADNGGPTLTHALAAGSLAIDAAPVDSDCPATDQRATPRPQGGGCDIGAFEK